MDKTLDTGRTIFCLLSLNVDYKWGQADGEMVKKGMKLPPVHLINLEDARNEEITVQIKYPSSCNTCNEHYSMHLELPAQKINNKYTL
jgi:hypothetical protein